VPAQTGIPERFLPGDGLLALITDILDLSKIEAGRMEVKPEQLPLSRLFENLGRTFQPIAAQKALEFQMHIAPGTPESRITDP
jgi:signal transduction histidine kinase